MSLDNSRHQQTTSTSEDQLTPDELAAAIAHAKKEKRTAQARLNGAKSKGPITPEGKATSSANSLVHGHAAKANILIELDDIPAWEAHIAGYYDSFHPTNYFETELVDELAAASWKKARLANILTALIDIQLSMQEHKMNEYFPLEKGNPQLHLAFAWQALARKALPREMPADPNEPIDPTLPPEQLDIESIELVRRYMMLHDRQFRAALLNLRQYRRDFPAPAAQPEIPANEAVSQPPSATPKRPQLPGTNEPTRITLVRSEKPAATTDPPSETVPTAPEVAA